MTLHTKGCWALILALGCGAPAGADTRTVAGGFYEKSGAVSVSGANFGVVSDDDKFSAGLMAQHFAWAPQPAATRAPPEGALFFYLGFSTPQRVAPYFEFAAEPLALLLALSGSSAHAHDTQTGASGTHQDGWDLFATLGVRVRVSRHMTVHAYHRWYDIYQYDPMTDANDIETRFHVWGGALNVDF